MSLRSLLDRYDRATERWAKINEEAEADGMPPSVKDCERYSAELEALAHEFAAFAWDQTYLLDAVQVEALKRVLGNAWQVWGDTEAFLVYRELVLRPRNAMGGTMADLIATFLPSVMVGGFGGRGAYACGQVKARSRYADEQELAELAKARRYGQWMVMIWVGWVTFYAIRVMGAIT